MAIGLFKKLFGGSSESSAPGGESPGEGLKKTGGQKDLTRKVVQTEAIEADPVEFVKYITSKLVVKPESVDVRVESQDKESDQGASVLITCDKEDMGRVIGKGGKTISAIRSLAIDAGTRAGMRNIQVEIQD